MKKQKEISLYTRADIQTRYTLENILGKEYLELEENVAEIDENMENLVAYIGRDLTEYEECRILEIVDEYTPKDKDGNYSEDLFSFEKAWRIYLENKEADWENILISKK